MLTPRPKAIKQFAETVSVSDIKLASSLMACGTIPVKGEEVSLLTGDRQLISFNFHPVTLDGGSVDKLIFAWKQEREATLREDEFSFQNPNDPLSYLMCCWDNYVLIRDYVLRNRPSVYIQKGSSVALVSPDSPQRIQDEILGRIGA